MAKKKTKDRAREARKVFAEGIPSLFDHMKDGNEYGSIVSHKLAPGIDVMDEFVRGIKEIESVRSRPCLVYVGNVVKQLPESGIDPTDDLPFAEMVTQADAVGKKVDVFLATNGGSAQQVMRFVDCLRTKYDEVDFLIPSFCMSAGTLFALSGDRIWMTPRACLGPIDPQVPNKDGRFVPLQALMVLVKDLQEKGQDALNKGMNVPWTAIRIIDSLDKKELAHALTLSQYSVDMATGFLERYKLGNWLTRETSKEPVTPEYRRQRAAEIALALASHDRWKNHGHAISREVLWEGVRLRIDHPDPNLNRVLARLWAAFNWFFDKMPALKVILSKEYRYLRYLHVQELKK